MTLNDDTESFQAMETIDEQRKEFAEHIGSKLWDRIRKRGNYCDGDVVYQRVNQTSADQRELDTK